MGKLYPKFERHEKLNQEIQDSPKYSSLWPKGTGLYKDGLFQEGRLCVPSQIEEEYLNADDKQRHTMPKRSAKDITRWTTIVGVYENWQKIRRDCQTCQGMNPAD